MKRRGRPGRSADRRYAAAAATLRLRSGQALRQAPHSTCPRQGVRSGTLRQGSGQASQGGLHPLRSVRASVSSRRDLRQAEAREFNHPRAVSGAILAAIAFAGIWIGFDELFYVPAPSVTGNQRVPAAEIVLGSGMAGLHVLWVNSSAVEAAMLQSVPSLSAARVSCALPAGCTIAVAEREPFLAWRWGQAEVWVDRTGVVFAAQGTAPDQLVVESIDAPALVPGRQAEPKVMSAIGVAAEALPDVRAYRYSVSRGLEFTDPNGFPVYLGIGSNMSDRAAVWRALREDLASRGIKPAYVDVRFPLAPYYER